MSVGQARRTVDASTSPKREYPFSDPNIGGTITAGLNYAAIGTVLVFVFLARGRSRGTLGAQAVTTAASFRRELS